MTSIVLSFWKFLDVFHEVHAVLSLEGKVVQQPEYPTTHSLVGLSVHPVYSKTVPMWDLLHLAIHWWYNCTLWIRQDKPGFLFWSSDWSHWLRRQVLRRSTQYFHIWVTMFVAKEDVTCCLHQHVLQCCGTQFCNCTMPGWGPIFEVELLHEQELAAVVRRGWAEGNDLLKLWRSDHTSTDEIALIQKWCWMPPFLTGSSFVGFVSGYKRRRQQAEIVHPSDETELLQHHTMKHRMTETVEVFHHNVLKFLS